MASSELESRTANQSSRDVLAALVGRAPSDGTNPDWPKTSVGLTPTPPVRGSSVDPDESGTRPAAGTPWLPPERLEQRRFGPPPPASIDEGGIADSRLESGLTELQEGYEQAFHSLFPEVFFGVPTTDNPFENAIDPGDGSPPPGADSGDGGEAPPPAEGGSGESSQPPPPTEPGGDAEPGGSGNPDGGDSGSQDPGFTFLVVADFSGNPSGSRISRAKLEVNGQFVLENSYRFSFFPGILHSLLTFEETEKVIVEDLDGDGQLDFVVATEVPAVGTAIESYLQRGPGQFQLTGTAFLYLQEIRSFALFDFNRDGKDELALALANHANLVVLENVGSEWLYLREISLPIQPALVMSAPVAVGVRTRSLFVLDESLQYVLSSNDRQPETFRLGSHQPLNHMRRIQVNLSGRDDDPGEVLLFGLPDRLVLCDGRGRSLRSFASFRLLDGAPLMIIGDYARTATRQMLWVP